MAVSIKWKTRSIPEEKAFLIELTDNATVDIWRVAQAKRRGKREDSFSHLSTTLLAAYLY